MVCDRLREEEWGEDGIYVFDERNFFDADNNRSVRFGIKAEK